MSLRDWDKIEVSVDEANRLATNGLVLEEGRVIIDADNARVIDELRKRRDRRHSPPFDGPIGTGGGLRCAHHPLLRESALVPPRRYAPRLGVRSKTTGLGRRCPLAMWTPRERTTIATWPPMKRSKTRAKRAGDLTVTNEIVAGAQERRRAKGHPAQGDEDQSAVAAPTTAPATPRESPKRHRSGAPAG